MSHPLLTIVTISKGDPCGLSSTLASLARLHASGCVEHIVVDGDGSAKALVMSESCGWLHQVGTGIAGAFNEGLAATNGEWVWFLNGGDSLDPRLSIEFLFELLRSSQADVIIGATTYEGEHCPRPHPRPTKQWPPVQPWIPHPSSLVRRRLFAQFGYFDERYGIVMDYEWWLRALSSRVVVDVISVPFAVFARGGLSQRPESMELIVRERDDAIRRHQRGLWRAVFSTVHRVGCMWLAAIFSWRIKRIDLRRRSV